MNKKVKKYIQIFANFLLLFFLLFIIYELLPVIVNLFIPFIIAFIVAMIAEPLVYFLESKIKIKRKYTAFVIIAFVLFGIGACLFYLVKWLYNFILSIIDDWDYIYQQILFLLQKADTFLKSININTDNIKITSLISKYANNFSENFIKWTSSFVLNIPLLIFGIIITIMAAYFIIQSHNMFFNNLIKKNKKIEKIKTEVIDQIFKYCKAQFKIMFVIFLILAVGLGVLKIKYFIPIAFIIAFIDLLPILGTGTVMIPWAIIDFIYGNYAKGIVLLCIYVIAMITRQILQPKIIGETMEFPPFLTLIVMWVGYKLFDITGLLLSVPVGILLLRLYKAGIFDVYINSIKFIINDIKTFLKIDFND